MFFLLLIPNLPTHYYKNQLIPSYFNTRQRDRGRGRAGGGGGENKDTYLGHDEHKRRLEYERLAFQLNMLLKNYSR